MRIDWTSADLQAFLAERSAQGLSRTAIAEELEISPDAVGGAMRRYGLFARTRGKRLEIKLAKRGAGDGD